MQLQIFYLDILVKLYITCRNMKNYILNAYISMLKKIEIICIFISIKNIWCICGYFEIFSIVNTINQK